MECRLLELDLRTVIVLNAAVMLLMSLGLMVAVRNYLGRVPGVGRWVVAALLLSAIWLLTFLRGTVPDRLLAGLGTCVVGLVAALFFHALVDFRGSKKPVRWAYGLAALNAALVPGYLRIRETEGQVAAAAFAGRVLGSVSLILIGIAVVLTLLMPLTIALLAPGFAGRDALQLAITDARLMMPYFAFVGPVTVMMGVLNAEHRFVLTAFSPVLFNVTLIAVLVVLLMWRHDAMMSATIISGAVGIAGCLQMLILIQRRPWRSGGIRSSIDLSPAGAAHHISHRA